jgi:hypothetical protein
MCQALATSREHVPPKCIFPERKDVGGDFRENLITVPSCREHNGRKSKDDEFLLVSLAGIIGNNSIGYRQRFTKVDRVLKRTSGRLLNQVFKTRKHYEVQLDENRYIEVIWGTPDSHRLHRCFDQIVRALYFHHFGAKFDGRVVSLLSNLTPSDKEAKELYRFLRDRAALDLRNKERYGANQDVFYYQVTDPDQFGLRLFHVCFYGGVQIYSSLLPSGTEQPYHLGLAMALEGFRTTITLGDEKCEFNKDNGGDDGHGNGSGEYL